MAWNDPGKNENPWQRRPDKGPPDLDEILRRLQKKLRGLFGGGGGGAGGGASGSQRRARIGIGSVVAGVVAVWVLFGSFYLIDAAERVVVLRFGKLRRHDEPAACNCALPWPIEPRAGRQRRPSSTASPTRRAC